MTENGAVGCWEVRNRSTAQQVSLMKPFRKGIQQAGLFSTLEERNTYLCSGGGWRKGDADRSLAVQLPQAIKMPGMGCLIRLSCGQITRGLDRCDTAVQRGNDNEPKRRGDASVGCRYCLAARRIEMGRNERVAKDVCVWKTLGSAWVPFWRRVRPRQSRCNMQAHYDDCPAHSGGWQGLRGARGWARVPVRPVARRGEGGSPATVDRGKTMRSRITDPACCTRFFSPFPIPHAGAGEVRRLILGSVL